MEGEVEEGNEENGSRGPLAPPVSCSLFLMKHCNALTTLWSVIAPASCSEQGKQHTILTAPFNRPRPKLLSAATVVRHSRLPARGIRAMSLN